jgi:hypothetical protein
MAIKGGYLWHLMAIKGGYLWQLKVVMYGINTHAPIGAEVDILGKQVQLVCGILWISMW